MASSAEVTVATAASRTGEDQYRRRWRIEDPSASILIVHGIGEHSGRYLHVGAFLAENGFDVTAFDNEGFGRSGGRRGHIDRFEIYLDAIEDLLTEEKSREVPVVLMGHSLGGLMSTAYLRSQRPQPDLAVLSAPALGAVIPRWQRVAAPVLGRVAPTFFVESTPMPALLTRDEAVQEAYLNDPLRVAGSTARLGQEVMTTMKAVSALNHTEFAQPVYVLHGDRDGIVPTSYTLPLAELESVTYRSWPGLEHECLNEPEQDEVMGEIVSWLRSALEKIDGSP